MDFIYFLEIFLNFCYFQLILVCVLDFTKVAEIELKQMYIAKIALWVSGRVIYATIFGVFA
jgi:hypothetical protein